MRPNSRRKRRQDEYGGDSHSVTPMAHDESNWLVSYADMMTLLFGFFVLMYSFSKIDEDKFEVVRKDLAKYFGGTLKDSVGSGNLKKKLETEISKIMGGEGGFNDQVQIKIKNNFIQMNFESQLMFAPGSAELTETSAKIVDKIAQELKKLPVEDIEINGHTDIDAIQSTVFPSNWELSASRSSRIVRRLSENGIEDKKLTAIGYGSSRPEFPHKDEAGAVIAENKAKNRRVVLNIRLKPDGNLSLKEIEKTGFRTISSTSTESSQTNAELLETNSKIVDIKKKLEETQLRYKEVTVRLKAAKELERSQKEMEKLTKKTEEMERKVQSIENNEINNSPPQNK